MRVAIPVFQSKISPRFDSTQDFVLLEIEKSKVMKREDLPTKGWPLSAKLKHMVDNMAAGYGRLPDAGMRQRMVQYMESI